MPVHQVFELYQKVSVSKMWFEKFVFFKGRRENKGPLPVPLVIDMLFLVPHRTSMFLLWVLQCFIQIGEQ